MADIIKLTDGYVSLQLYNDTSGFQMLADGNKFGLQSHNNLFHESDFSDDKILIRQQLGNAEWNFKLSVNATTNDGLSDLLNALSRIRRQAITYQTQGSSARKVYLSIQLDGATQATCYDVIDIEYDGLGIFDYYNIRSKSLQFDDGLSIKVLTKPLGYGNEETLANEILNGDFFTDTGGLGTGWTEVGTPTTSINTTNYLSAQRSQKVVTQTSGDEGVYFQISATAYRGDPVVASAWVYLESGDTVTGRLYGDVSGTIQEYEYASAAAKRYGDSGKQWRHIKLYGTVGASDTIVRLYVLRKSSVATQATTFYIDCAYLDFFNTACPNGWAGYKTTTNIPSGETTRQSIDLLLAGDASPQYDLSITLSNTSNAESVLVMSHPQKDITIEAESYDVGGAAWDVGIALGCSGSCAVIDTTGGGGPGIYYITTGSFTGDRSWRILARCKSTSLNNSAYFVLNDNYSQPSEGSKSNTLSVNTVSKWEMLDFGIVTPAITEEFIDKIITGAMFTAWVTVSSGTFSIDYIKLIPTSNSNYALIFKDKYSSGGIDDTTYEITAKGNVYRDSTSSRTIVLGNTPVIEQYSQDRITIFGLPTNASYEDLLTATFTTSITYRPRTETLLGIT